MKTLLRTCAVLAMMAVATASVPQPALDVVSPDQAVLALDLQAPSQSTTAMLLLSDVEMAAVHGAGRLMDDERINEHCRAYTSALPSILGRAAYKGCVWLLERVS